MMKRVDVNGGSEKSDSEKSRPDICHVCMTRGELGKDLFYCARCQVLSMMMIAFITFKSSLVPLFEGL